MPITSHPCSNSLYAKLAFDKNVGTGSSLPRKEARRARMTAMGTGGVTVPACVPGEGGVVSRDSLSFKQQTRNLNSFNYKDETLLVPTKHRI